MNEEQIQKLEKIKSLFQKVMSARAKVDVMIAQMVKLDADLDDVITEVLADIQAIEEEQSQQQEGEGSGGSSSESEKSDGTTEEGGGGNDVDVSESSGDTTPHIAKKQPLKI